MRLKDAYRKGTISYNEYLAFLDDGHNPNDPYSTPYTPAPSPTNAWLEILDWDCEGLGAKSITIENTDAVYSLEYSIELYNDDILVTEYNDFIEYASVSNFYFGDPYTDIVVSVRSSNYGSSPSYDYAYTNVV